MDDTLDPYYHGHEVTMVSHDHGQTPLAMHINNMSMTSSNSSLSWNTPLTSPIGTPGEAPPSERAVHLNNLYMQSKTEMLGIIEEGLQLKLQIQTIKDQFFQLVNDFGTFEHEEMEKRQQTSDNLPPRAVEAIQASGSKMSAGRARVRALYETRKARIREKRATLQENTERHIHTIKQQRGSPSTATNFRHVDEDKENVFDPICGSTPLGGPKPGSSTPEATDAVPLTEANLKNFTQVPMRTMTWSIKKFLTPIKEEHPETFTGPGQSKKGRHKSTPRPKEGSRSVKPKFSREYVNLRASGFETEQYIDPLINFQAEVVNNDLTFKGKRSRQKACSRVPLEHSPTCMDISERLDHRRSSVPSEWHEGCDSDVANSIYTCKSLKDVTHRSLKDISQISQISSPHEQVSSANLTGAFHSTFNYPLHSTMNNFLHSHLNLSDIKPMDQSDTLGDHNDSVIHRRPVDTQTTISEPIAHYRRQEQRHCLSVPPRAMDDSYMDYQLLANSQASTSRGSSRDVLSRQSFSPSSYKTPTKKPQATLCKEHGLHPTFGGPCIFATDNSTMFDDSSCPELDVDENDNTPKAPNQTAIEENYSKQRVTMTETDCDSSYLSECIDDQHFSQGYSELEYTAVYDTETARMKMLKRQTGQAELKHLKQPVGLSESDLIFDVTRKQVSMEATRASMPDLSGLSTMPSTEMEDDDQSESTLHASSPKKSRTGSLHHDSDGFRSANDTMIGAEQTALSVSTTDDSPSSNTGITVPVNSPNITDSTGSSSRPTTDNYDYMEAPPLPTGPVPRINDSSVLEHSISNKKPSLISCLRPSIASKSSKSRRTHSSSNSKSQPMHHRKLEPTPPRKKSKRRSSKSSSRPASERAPSVSHDARSTGRTAISCYSRSTRSRPHSSQDWDSGCSVYSSRPHSQQFMISDNTGQHRTIVHHAPVSKDLPQHRKKALAKKLKHFSGSFYNTKSTGNLELETLAHF